MQACAGIGYAHRAGLVHCDVKPHNMLVTPDERLKVTDFGIARALATLNPGERSDVVWGSPQYYSPEQAAGHAPSPASDVYSLGVVPYEALTGTLPFTAATPEALARMHLDAYPIPSVNTYRIFPKRSNRSWTRCSRKSHPRATAQQTNLDACYCASGLRPNRNQRLSYP